MGSPRGPSESIIRSIPATGGDCPRSLELRESGMLVGEAIRGGLGAKLDGP